MAKMVPPQPPHDERGQKTEHTAYLEFRDQLPDDFTVFWSVEPLTEDAEEGEIDFLVDLDALVYDYLYDEHGVAFYRDRSLGADDEGDVLGMTLPLENAIYVDAKLAESGHRGRYRFTVAHEIGHWMLHRPLLLEEGEHGGGDVRFVTLERDVVDRTHDPESDYRPEEWQANAFAIWLLLPDGPLHAEFTERYGEPPVCCDPG